MRYIPVGRWRGSASVRLGQREDKEVVSGARPNLWSEANEPRRGGGVAGTHGNILAPVDSIADGEPGDQERDSTRSGAKTLDTRRR